MDLIKFILGVFLLLIIMTVGMDFVEALYQGKGLNGAIETVWNGDTNENNNRYQHNSQNQVGVLSPNGN
jgi:hypothetical protein